MLSYKPPEINIGARWELAMSGLTQRYIVVTDGPYGGHMTAPIPSFPDLNSACNWGDDVYPFGVADWMALPVTLIPGKKNYTVIMSRGYAGVGERFEVFETAVEALKYGTQTISQEILRPDSRAIAQAITRAEPRAVEVVARLPPIPPAFEIEYADGSVASAAAPPAVEKIESPPPDIMFSPSASRPAPKPPTTPKPPPPAPKMQRVFVPDPEARRPFRFTHQPR